MTNDDPQKHDPETAREVDRLLRKLRFPPPSLYRDPVRPSREQPRVDRPSHPVQAPEPPRSGGVWGRVALGIVLSVAITQWPYANACGFRLALYLTAVGMVIVCGIWAAVGAWQRRLPAAHVVSLLVIAWGGTLATREVLPRTGYARSEAHWRCPATAMSGIPPRVAAVRPTPPGPRFSPAAPRGGSPAVPTHGTRLASHMRASRQGKPRHKSFIEPNRGIAPRPLR